MRNVTCRWSLSFAGEYDRDLEQPVPVATPARNGSRKLQSSPRDRGLSTSQSIEAAKPDQAYGLEYQIPRWSHHHIVGKL